MPYIPQPDDKNRQPVTTTAFAINTDYNVKAKGYAGTATHGTDTNVDFAIGSEDRYINGIRLILRNHVWGDTIGLQVVDKDNVLGLGAGVVLNQFAYTWNPVEGVYDQGQTVFNYAARLPAGTYIRLVYHSTGGTDVDILLNCLMHKKVSTT